MTQFPFAFGEIPQWTPPELPSLDGHTEVTIDTETDGLEWFRGARPVGMALRFANKPARYIPWAHRGGQNLDEATVRRWMQRELRGKRIRNLNTRFDVHMLRAWGVDLAAMGCTFHDVAHSAALLDDHRRSFALDALALDYCGEGKLSAGRPAEIAQLPASAVAAYAIRDVELVDLLYAAFEPRLAAEDLGRVSALEDAVIPVVCEMEKNGCPIDEEKLDRWVNRSAEILEDLLWDISREVGFSVNPDRNADLVRVFGQLGIVNPHRTAKGAVSFPADYMRTVEHPTVQKIFRAGKLIDLRAKYLLPYSKMLVDGVLYGSYHQLRADEGGTVSGRFSATKPNLQQVMTPGKQLRDYGSFEGETFIIKELFVPKQGVWLCADQEQVEFRIAAHYSKAARVLAAYAEDPTTDFHVVVRDIIRTRKPTFERKPAKDCNFATIYGAGRGRRAAMMGLSTEEADAVQELYDAEFPEMKAIFRKAVHAAESRGHVKTILGRRSRFPDKKFSHKALNCVIQGSAADGNKLTLVEVYKERERLGLTMRATVHDELDGDLHDPSSLAAVTEVLNRQLLDLDVPILWAAKTGKNWAEAK
jgi:DNA polymerase I-like protein with 3'-5' exonuclease and polymerase domains